MLASGDLAKHKDMEYMYGSMGIDTKEVLKIAWNMVKELRNLQMAIFTKGNMQEENQMDMVNTIGQMEATIKEGSKMAWEKDMECGKKV